MNPSTDAYSALFSTVDVRLRVLVVDDNPLDVQVARGVFRWLGHEVEVASSGTEALGALRQVPYDLVLMDLEMDGLSGFQTTRLIRGAQLSGRQPWIIGLTGGDFAGTEDRCLAAGMDDFHEGKPLRFSTLRRLLARLFEARAAEWDPRAHCAR